MKLVDNKKGNASIRQQSLRDKLSWQMAWNARKTLVETNTGSRPTSYTLSVNNP